MGRLIQTTLNLNSGTFTFYIYVRSIVITVLALLLTGLCWTFIHDAPFLIFYGAVVLSAWRGGIGPAMVSAAFAVITLDFFMIEPLYTMYISPANVIQFAIFVLVALLVGSLEQTRLNSKDQLQELKDELSVILNSVADGITAQDADGKAIFANNSAAVLTGHPSAEAMINRPINHMHPKFHMYDSQGQKLPFSALPRNHVFQTGRTASLTFKMCYTDNDDEKWIHIRSAPVFDHQGNVKLAVNIFQDITDQVEAQLYLRRYEAIIQNSNDAIMGKSLDGYITNWNPGAERIYGYTPEEAIGQHISFMFPKNIETQEMLLQQRIRRGERIEHYETKRIHKKGHEVDVSLTISPIRTSNGQIVGYSTIERDITSRKLFEELQRDAQERVRKVLDNLSVFVGILTPEGVVIEANHAFLESAHVKADEVVGKPFEETYWWDFSDESRIQMKNNIMKAKAGETVRDDMAMRVSAGNFLTIDFILAPILDDEGQVQYLVPSGVDITERNRLMQQLDAQREQLDAIIQSVPGLIYDVTVDLKTSQQRVNFISDYIEQMLGYTSDDWSTNPKFWEDIMTPNDLENALTVAQSAYEDDRPGNVEFRCRHKDGHTVFAEAFFSFKTVGDQVRQYGVIMDISRRKHVESQLRSYMNDLKRSNEELQQFAYVASHDLQEPLRMVTSYLQLIERRYTDQLDDNAHEFISFAVDGATRMKALINDLLAYSRVQTQTGELKTVDMSDVLDKVMTNLQLQIKDSCTTITADDLPEILAVEGQMVQLLQNLLSNAIKFQSDDPPTIHIGVERKSDCWQFCVRDNGIGIDPKYQDRVFVIFQRLHTRRDYDGTGIGLAICRKIIDRHRGDIWFETHQGEGTTFYFTLPFKL